MRGQAALGHLAAAGTGSGAPPIVCVVPRPDDRRIPQPTRILPRPPRCTDRAGQVAFGVAREDVNGAMWWLGEVRVTRRLADELRHPFVVLRALQAWVSSLLPNCLGLRREQVDLGQPALGREPIGAGAGDQDVRQLVHNAAGQLDRMLMVRERAHGASPQSAPIHNACIELDFADQVRQAGVADAVILRVRFDFPGHRNHRVERRAT